MEKTVLLGMSGGLDSSTSVYLLQKMGYKVTGATLVLHDEYKKNDLEDAKEAAKRFNIEHIIIDKREIFQKEVIDYFIDSYLSGKTPNPCPRCNVMVKFASLYEKAQELGIKNIATGHYALVDQYQSEQRLFQSADLKKSQEYFLSLLPPHILNSLILPLSKYTKDEVREIAKENNLAEWSVRKESQEICFIPSNDYVDFIENKSENLPGEGDIITDDGKTVGKHKGFFKYTIGQRRGIGVGLGKPQYVIGINPTDNKVVIGDKEKARKKEITILLQNEYEIVNENSEYNVKIRYKSRAQRAKITKITDKKLTLEAFDYFDAPSAGQLAVFYDNYSMVLAAGTII